jgi:purine-nucleoside phosphorylase
MYEGHDAGLAAFPIRVAHALGARTVIVTNAAGGVRPTFRPGDLMLIDDHINFAFRNPLVGEVEPGDVRFPDMSSPYDAALQQTAREVAAAQGLTLEQGVYMWLLGPTYETAAEVRMAALLGADAVGMSTVPEVVVARARGMRVLGISCITNLACGLSGEEITHAEVLETTARVGDRLRRLIVGILAQA